jgi:hypothetical protein
MRRFLVAIALVTLIGLSAFAYGGGGVFSSEQVVIEPYNNIGLQLETHGGYGYGVDRRGIRTGGFGMVVYSDDQHELAGAFGGFITGAQQRIGPFTASINLWSGVGYINPVMIDIPGYAGFIAEANAEVGFAPLPWFQLSLYAGMQAFGGFDIADILTQVRYSPVIGSRVTWGGF